MPADRRQYSAPNGFTLVELLIVIGILAITAALSVPFLSTLQSSSDFSSEFSQLAGAYERARQQSVDGLHATGWGIYLDATQHQYILFAGSDFANRDQTLDEVFAYTDRFTLSSDLPNPSWFHQVTGLPSASGTVTFIGDNSETAELQLNSVGRIRALTP